LLFAFHPETQNVYRSLEKREIAPRGLEKKQSALFFHYS